MASRPTVPNVSAFARLHQLLDGIPPGMSEISMLIGEPRHPLPDFVGPVLMDNLAGFGRYPITRGTDRFRAAVAAWLGRRYGLGTPIDPATMEELTHKFRSNTMHLPEDTRDRLMSIILNLEDHTVSDMVRYLNF